MIEFIKHLLRSKTFPIWSLIVGVIGLCLVFLGPQELVIIISSVIGGYGLHYVASLSWGDAHRRWEVKESKDGKTLELWIQGRIVPGNFKAIIDSEATGEGRFKLRLKTGFESEFNLEDTMSPKKEE